MVEKTILPPLVSVPDSSRMVEDSSRMVEDSSHMVPCTKSLVPRLYLLQLEVYQLASISSRGDNLGLSLPNQCDVWVFFPYSPRPYTVSGTSDSTNAASGVPWTLSCWKWPWASASRVSAYLTSAPLGSKSYVYNRWSSPLTLIVVLNGKGVWVKGHGYRLNDLVPRLQSNMGTSS